MKETFKIKKESSWSALSVLLWTMAFVFIINKMSAVWFGNHSLEQCFPLSLRGLKEGQLWQPLSYMFMHGGIWHIFCNAIVLLFIGKVIEQKYGNKRLLVIFFISGLIGAGMWFLVHSRQPYGTLLGASAGCLGVFSYFCLVCQNRPMTFLLFFIIPLRLKPRILLAIAASLEMYCLFMQELVDGNVANSAHLGGIVGGLICYFFYRYRGKYVNIFTEKSNGKSNATSVMHGDNYKLYITSHSARRSEVNRILDKINESGLKSLTEAERNTLNAAKHLMYR